ncbi:hypothetical protein CRX53_20240 [Leclercia adecarboxylata]|uniref:L-asparaginase n=1 Tax=Leclercia adecarboxylata TaxID=83655 RepID=A0A855F021_9ENTR|nr:hypothetical protein CRX53_20240 [Leclercia adecarboxylata]
MIHRAIFLVILDLGSAQTPRVLRVRCGSCALSVSRLTATMTPAKSRFTAPAHAALLRYDYGDPTGL